MAGFVARARNRHVDGKGGSKMTRSQSPIPMPRLARLGSRREPALVSLPEEVPPWVADEIKADPALSRSHALIKVCQRPLAFTPQLWDAVGDLERDRRLKNPVAEARPILAPLANFLHRAIGFNDEVRLTKSERKEIAADIRKLGNRLAKVLRRFNTASEYPEWQMACLRSSHEAMRHLMKVSEDDLPSESELDSWLRGVSTAAMYPEAILRSVIVAAGKWSEPAHLNLHRPREATAARTYFIKSLGISFERRYGDACPKIIDGLVAALFEGSESPLSKQEIEQRLAGRSRGKRGSTKR